MDRKVAARRYIFILTHCKNLDFKKAISILKINNHDSLDDFSVKDPLSFIGQLLSYLINTIKNKSTNPVEEGMIK